MEHLIENLNEAQQAVVTAPCGHQLVLAGAGSGKTRVLVHRIAWLLQVENASPHNILAVTFTNKAAGEMRSRIERLLSYPAQSMWIGTFHSLAHRLLRIHWQEAGLKQNFQILDSEDQNRLVKRVIRGLNLDEKHWSPKHAQWFINSQKDAGLRPEHIDDDGDLVTKTLLKIYHAYEAACHQGGLVDFAELLLRSHELWLHNPDILTHYQQRFQHILVDEFQDTNPIQYAWIRLLAGNNAYVMVVGDDDQSIYGWRGAKVENIQRFTFDYPTAQTIRLEQNYRSTNTILSAANAMIANNSSRLGKNLWSAGEDGELIAVYSGFNEIDEARYVTSQIEQWVSQGHARREIALLYRSNAQSRALEEALIQARIPYRVYGGLRYFERAEIKDALAYLRLLSNRDDDAAFERVVNLPTRGIGDRTLTEVRALAREQQLPMWQASEQIIQQQTLSARASNALQNFLDLIKEIEATTRDLELHEMVDHVLVQSGLLDHYRRDKTEKGRSRVENLEELIQATKQFTPDAEQEAMTPLSAFLSHVALESGESQADPHSDCVQLMTMHSAKGLEFPMVIICGMEEGLFPHYLSEDDPMKLEEERRLFYVGMTRAMHRLILTHAETRRLHGKENYHRPSRFMSEIPKEYLQEVRLRNSNRVTIPKRQSTLGSSQGVLANPNNDLGLKLGQRVRHEIFGEGTILNFEGRGAHTRVQVKFDDEGTKWLVASYANLCSA